MTLFICNFPEFVENELSKKEIVISVYLELIFNQIYVYVFFTKIPLYIRMLKVLLPMFMRIIDILFIQKALIK